MSSIDVPIKTGKNGISKMQDNRIDDGAFVQKALTFNMEVYNLGKLGKPPTKQDMEDRIKQYFTLCTEYELNPTVERTCSCS